MYFMYNKFYSILRRELHRVDFRDLFKVYDGKSISIKLLDQSLQDFLPINEVEAILSATQLNLSVNTTFQINIYTFY